MQTEESKIPNRIDKVFIKMLTTTSRNHYTLNQMVDRKAKILLSINALILSLIIGKIIINHDMHDFKFFLLLILGSACLGSIIYSMLAILPEKSHGKLDENSIRNHTGNPLFFGNFKDIPGKIYEETMIQMAHDQEFVYRAMIQDIYHLGQILEQKRKYLRSSLYLFIGGLCLTLSLAFVLKILLTG